MHPSLGPLSEIDRWTRKQRLINNLLEQLKSKERNLFFRFILLLKKSWPTKGQTQLSDILNISIDSIALSILHQHLDRNQRRAFILACLNEEKNN